MNWWRHIPEHIDPVIVEIGSFQLRYYGLMYLIAFAITYSLILYRLKTEKYEYSKNTVQTFFMYAISGVLIGGKLGYVLFYDPMQFISHPLRIFNPFGMSYHGGLVGVITASLFFCYNNRVNFWHFADMLTPTIPLGYTFGRLGNFVNGELFGRVTTAAWGMYFPMDPTGQLRHPSQLYEAFFEGIFLFIILWSLRKKRVFNGFHLCLYIISYGMVRFCVEFAREPDPGMEYIWRFFTMGQILSIAMVLGGAFIMLTKTVTSRQPCDAGR